MKETIWINKDIETVWNFVELEFAKAFKCSPKKLPEKELKLKHGSKKITQSIPVHDKPNHLVLLSEDDTDLVETHYKFHSDELEGSYIEMYEIGKGKKSIFKSLFYKVMDLPLLRAKKRKRLRHRLESIKYFLELEDQDDSVQEA